MSSFISSINLLFGLPLDLLSGSSNLIILLLIYSLSLLCTCPNHLSLTFSPKHLACVVSLMYLFLILSILITHIINHTSLVSPLSCTHFLSFYPVDLKYLKSSTFFNSAPCSRTVPLGEAPHIHIRILSCWNYPSLRSFSDHTSTSLLLHLLLELTTDHNVICKHHSPWRFLSYLICQFVHHHRKQEADPWCSPTSTLSFSVTPTAHLSSVLQLSYISCNNSNILLCYSRLPHVIPSFLPWNSVICFLKVYKDTKQLSLTFSVLLYQHPLKVIKVLLNIHV